MSRKQSILNTINKTEKEVLTKLESSYSNCTVNNLNNDHLDFEYSNSISTTETSFLIIIYKMLQEFKKLANTTGLYYDSVYYISVNYVGSDNLVFATKISELKNIFDKLFNNPSYTYENNILTVTFYLLRIRIEVEIELIGLDLFSNHTKNISKSNYGILDFEIPRDKVNLIEAISETTCSLMNYSNISKQRYKAPHRIPLFASLSNFINNDLDNGFIKPEDLFL